MNPSGGTSTTVYTSLTDPRDENILYMCNLCHVRMKKSNQGVAGFFADIPALLAIMIGIWLFTFSLYHTHSRYIEEVQKESMHVEVEDFVRVVRSHHLLAISPGVFCVERLECVNISLLMEYLDPMDMGFHYRIDIKDDSMYQDSFTLSMQTSTLPQDRDIYSRTSSIVVVHRDGSRHLSSLQVRLWRYR